MYSRGGIYHLMAKVSHKNFLYGFSILKKENLHPGQMPLLARLWKEEGLSQRELAKRLDIKPSTLNVMIGRLEKNGYIRKEHDPNDQRRSLIYFTEEGRTVCGKMKKKFSEFRDVIMDNFSEEEKEELCRLLQKFCDCLDEQMKQSELRKDKEGNDA